MPELDAEHRDQMADLLKRHLPKDRYDENGDTVSTYCIGCDWTGDYFADGEAGPFDDHVADALAPLVAGWIAEERERARFNDEVRREQIRMARADALREAADNIHEVSGHSAGVPVWRSQVADWLNERADRGGDDG